MSEKETRLRPSEGQCLMCGKTFSYVYRSQGGGTRKKYCSPACRSKHWTKKYLEKRTAIVLKYEKVTVNKERKRLAGRKRSLLKKYDLSYEAFQKELERQNFSCYGCLKRIDEDSARADHNHATKVFRGLLCDSCNWALGHVYDEPATLRRLMAYLDHDREKTSIYLAGALKNPRIPVVGNALRNAGYDVMDEWFTPGEFADTNLQAYEKLRGRTFKEALYGRSVTNTFLFDKVYLELADVVVMLAPAGKSAMLELGYAKGRGKHAWILLDGPDPDRYDIMPAIADRIFQTEEELLKHLQENFK